MAIRNRKEYRLKNRERINAQARTRFHCIPNRYSYSKNSAKQRNKIWTISLEDYEWLCSLDCYYCTGKFGKVVCGVGLDRIESAKGYTLDNVVTCCTICNRVKGDYFSLEATKFMVDSLIAKNGL